MAGPIAGITLDAIFNDEKFKETRRLMDQAFDQCLEKKFEFGGVAYINRETQAIKLAGPTTANLNYSNLETFVKIPDGFDQILLAYHTHPGLNVPGCVPSGVSDNSGDVAKAKSAPWNGAYFFVITGLADPVKPRQLEGKCEVVHAGTTRENNNYRVWLVRSH